LAQAFGSRIQRECSPPGATPRARIAAAMEPGRSVPFGLGPGGGGGSYARRHLGGGGDPKSGGDRNQRLLTDRAAYIAFLEAQAERAGEICAEAEAVNDGLRRLRGRVDELEEKVRSAARTAELVQEHGARAGEAARTSRQEVEEQLRVVEGRVERLEQGVGEARITAEAEMARLRNEVSLAVQELSQRIDERFQAMSQWCSQADESASGVIREAQVICVRLADDALGAAEASQLKVEDLARRTEASLEVLRVDLTGLHAELTGLTRAAESSGSGAGAAAGAPPTEEAAATLADAVERRLGARLGQQVLQLGEVLRRVIQAQTALHQQVARAPFSAPGVSIELRQQMEEERRRQAGDFDDILERTRSRLSTQVDDLRQRLAILMASDVANGGSRRDAAGAATDTRRRCAIDELYRELRRLEECDGHAGAPAGALEHASSPWPSAGPPARLLAA